MKDTAGMLSSTPPPCTVVIDKFGRVWSIAIQGLQGDTASSESSRYPKAPCVHREHTRSHRKHLAIRVGSGGKVASGSNVTSL